MKFTDMDKLCQMQSGRHFNQIFFVLDTCNEELTPQRLYELSLRITTLKDLRTLATNGLKVPEYNIDSICTDKCDSVNEAALEVLKTWLKMQENRTEAYDNLCNALRKVKMDYYIKDALSKK